LRPGNFVLIHLIKTTMMEVKDSNGNLLQAGDTVQIIKSLKVKGGNDLKQGTVVKNIRLTDDEEAIEGKVDGVMMVLKTMYLKKKS
jgi:protein PhnA